MSYPIRVGKLRLSEHDCNRLMVVATMFGFHVSRSGAGMQIERARSRLSLRYAEWSTGMVRLVTEMCSLSMRWIRYNDDESCAETLLRHTDEQLCRIAELEAQHAHFWATLQKPPDDSSDDEKAD